MKKLKALFIGVVALAMITSCSMTIPVCATGNTVGAKVGEASGTGYLGIIKLGVDASIKTAAKNGGIKNISTVDFKVDDLFGFVQTYTCIVTGK